MSIYGILPVAGKFIGFFLVPIYARVFQSTELGQVELITTLVSFLVFLINLEFYTSIGRYFYEKETIEKQRILVSTGLWMTVLSTLIVLLFCFLFQDSILRYYLNDPSLSYVLKIGFIYLAIDGVATYISVIPRYTKKAKQYVVNNVSSILIRVLSTIFCVCVLNTGIVGVLYGHIIGTLSCLLLNAIISKQFLAFSFNFQDSKLIFWYSIPLIPSIIIFSIWAPILRKSTELLFSVSVVGLYSFAGRVTSITRMFQSALINAWRPILFENQNNPSFLKDVKKNSGIVAFGILGIGSFVSLFSYELCLYIGTVEYVESFQLFPFLCLAGYFQASTQLRGFGPLLNNRTYIHSLSIMLSFIISIAFLFFVKSCLGLIGLGITLVLYDGIQYIVLYLYTKRNISAYCSSLIPKWELLILLLFFAMSIASLLRTDFTYRVLLCVIALILYYYIGSQNVILPSKVKNMIVKQKN